MSFDVIDSHPCRGGHAVFAELTGKSLMSFIVFWTRSLDNLSERTEGELFFESEQHIAVNAFLDMVETRFV